MVIDFKYISIFLFGFNYLPVFIGEKFLFFLLSFLPCILPFSFSNIPYLSYYFSSFFHHRHQVSRASYMEQNSTRVVL